MKIAQVISTPPFAWATGGPARVAFDLSRALARRGHDVDILTTDLFERDRRYPTRVNPEIIDGVRIHRFHCTSHWLAWRYKGYISPGLILHLRRCIKDYDVVHLHDLISPQAVATSRFCHDQKMPYALAPHGSLPWLLQPKFVNHFYYDLFGRNVVDYATGICALNNMEVGHCGTLGVPIEKVHVVPNGIDLSEYESLPKRGALRSKHGIGDDDPLLLFLGRLHKIKGLDLLVQSFSDLVKDVPRARLMIAGPDDGFLTILKEMAGEFGVLDKVVFTGPLYGQEKIQAYADADVYVLPSVYEMFPMTLLEAAAAGLPLIVTDRCGMAETVRGRGGYVVPFDRTELRQAMHALVVDEEERRKMGKGCQECIAREFSWESIAPRAEHMYQGIMNDGYV